MLILTITSHTLEGLPGAPQSSILIMIAIELLKCAQSLFFCAGEVTYELWTLSHRFGIRNQGWGYRFLNGGCGIFFDISDIRIFSLNFGVPGRETRWRALAVLLGRA